MYHLVAYRRRPLAPFDNVTRRTGKEQPVQDDEEPAAPHLPPYARYDPSEREPGDMPTWPAIERQSPRTPAGGEPTMPLAIALGVSLVANGALFVALVSVILFARVSFFSPRASSSQLPPASSATSTASGLASPTPVADGLEVAPTSVQLGCDGDQATQFVVLANTGTADIRWQVEFSGSADQVGVAVDPTDGDLSAGTSIALQISNTSHGDAQQGVIRFVPDASVAGASPTLSYTTSNCS
jgi:hypothetical protein